jgi:hypothetical protein
MTRRTNNATERLRDHIVLLACVLVGALYIGNASQMGAPAQSDGDPVSMTHVKTPGTEYLILEF